ncbi:cytochrome P450 2J3-like [Patiria miniata]|uniref:Cytochrome P450 n=1 Tax=Patiria miniata TaxID=46514 RepID=A0A914A9T3_PATMI|nr:cytochrome P450 2J3-like [Patiria miniata]
MAGQNSAAFSSLTGALDLKSAGVFLLIFLVVLWLFRGRQKNLPPGPWRWPLLGNLPAMVRSKKHAHEVVAEWSRQYGGVMSVGTFLGRSPVVVISEIDAAKEVFLKPGVRLMDRSTLPLAKYIAPLEGSLMWAKGETARAQRKFGLGAFRKFGVGKKSLEHKINEEARYLVEGIENEKNRSFDPNLNIHKAVSNIICTVCFGYRFDYDDPKFKKLLRSVQVTFASTGVDALANIFPVLIQTPLYSKMQAGRRFIQDHINEVIQEHQESYDPNDFRDIIDMYIGEIKERERSGASEGTGDSEAFAHHHIWRFVFDMFGAGTDTASHTILWLISCLLNYPEIQEKMQREISEVVGGDRQPSCEDRPSMPYTNAVLNEIQRWRPVAPFTLPYETTQEIQLKGYTIPKGRTVIIHLWAMMNDPRVWDCPEEFNPDRFLSEDGTKLIQHERFNPFSVGRRSCLGEGLARMELFLFVTNLFQRFTFKLPLGAPKPSMRGVPSFLYSPDRFEVCAVKR